MRDGVRDLNVARGGLIDDQALQAALDSGKVAGAALNVFPAEPITITRSSRLGPNVVVTPHLGASTAEATYRAGYQSAEQVRRCSDRRSRLDGRPTSRRSAPRTWRRWGPFLPLARQLGRLAMALAEGSSVERIEAGLHGPDRRLRYAPARRSR